MILYHYTARRLIESIKQEGITLGRVVDLGPNGEYIFHEGYIWLTTNSNAHDQEWNVRVRIPYDRAEYRITVDIPAPAESNVLNWLEFCQRLDPQIRVDLNAFGDPQNWRLYHGAIPPEWFKDIARKLVIAA